MSDVTYTDLAIAFCRVFDVSEQDLQRAGCKYMPMVRIRWALWTALREAGYGVSQIGRRCKRDHSTVGHAIDRFAVIVHDAQFLADVEKAKALAVEIATQRAAGAVFDLVAIRRQEAINRLSARKPRAANSDPDEDPMCASSYERSFRAECTVGSERLLEALKQEVGGT